MAVWVIRVIATGIILAYWYATWDCRHTRSGEEMEMCQAQNAEREAFCSARPQDTECVRQ